MTNKFTLVVFVCLLICFILSIESRQSLLQCWRCDVSIESIEESGVYTDDCQASFDFTEHTVEDCDGKCWRSVDLLDLKHLGNNSRERLLLKDNALASLRSSRRCFSSDELLRAAEMGISTSNGCRKIQRENEKAKEICFCSDRDLCNHQMKLFSNSSSFLFCLNICFYYFSYKLRISGALLYIL